MFRALSKAKLLLSGRSISQKAHFLAFSEDTEIISADKDAPSFLPGFVCDCAAGFELTDVAKGTIRNVSGRTVTVTGTISFRPVKGVGGTVVVSVLSERSTDDITYVVKQGSLIPVEVSSTGQSFKTSVSFAVTWANGEYIRFRAYTDGAATLSFEQSSDTVLGGQAITGHSMIWELSEK